MDRGRELSSVSQLTRITLACEERGNNRGQGNSNRDRGGCIRDRAEILDASKGVVETGTCLA